MKVKIHPSWAEVLQQEFTAPYFEQLTTFVRNEYTQGPCYPPGGEIFNAFNLCPFDHVKVIIIGQDPYHGPGQAEGLCFSVKDGVRIPPSLVNIFKEIHDDTGRPIPTSGSCVDGLNKEYSCSMPHSPYASTKLPRTQDMVGKHSPMP